MKSWIISLAFLTWLIWIWGADGRRNGVNSDPNTKMSQLIDGSAPRPYVARFLIPVTVRSIAGLIDPSTKAHWTDELLSIRKVDKEVTRLQWERPFLIEYVLAFGIDLIFLILTGFAFAGLLEFFLKLPDRAVILSIAIFFAAMVPMFAEGPHYLYDFPSLFFFTACTLLLLQDKRGMFLALFALGLLNKETVFFSIAPFLARDYFSQKKPTWYAIPIAMFASSAILKFALFHDNPGSMAEFHLHANIHWILTGWGFVPLVVFVTTIMMLHLGFKTAPIELRYLSLNIPLFLVLISITCIMNEWRDYYEIYPVAVLLFVNWMKGREGMIRGLGIGAEA